MEFIRSAGMHDLDHVINLSINHSSEVDELDDDLTDETENRGVSRNWQTGYTVATATWTVLQLIV